MVILNIHGSLYFAAVQRLESQLPAPQHTVVILRLRESAHLGSTGLRFLLRYQEQLRQAGGELLIVGLSGQIWQELEHTGMVSRFGANNLYRSENTYFGATERAYHIAMQQFTDPGNTEQDQVESGN